MLTVVDLLLLQRLIQGGETRLQAALGPLGENGSVPDELSSCSWTELQVLVTALGFARIGNYNRTVETEVDSVCLEAVIKGFARLSSIIDFEGRGEEDFTE